MLFNWCFQCLTIGPPPSLQLRIVHGPPDSSDTQREEDFQKSLGAMKSVVQRIVAARREGRDTTELPLIDALLQSGVPEKQVTTGAFCHT